MLRSCPVIFFFARSSYFGVDLFSQSKRELGCCLVSTRTPTSCSSSRSLAARSFSSPFPLASSHLPIASSFKLYTRASQTYSLLLSYPQHLSVSASSARAQTPTNLSEQLPLLLSQVVPRGPADRTGRIKVGDQILRVNQMDCVGMPVSR